MLLSTDTLERLGSMFDHLLNIKGAISHHIDVGADAVGNMTRIANAMSGMETKLAKVEDQLSAVREQLESAKEEVETFRRIDSNMASLLRDLKITKADIE